MLLNYMRLEPNFRWTSLNHMRVQPNLTIRICPTRGCLHYRVSNLQPLMGEASLSSGCGMEVYLGAT